MSDEDASSYSSSTTGPISTPGTLRSAGSVPPGSTEWLQLCVVAEDVEASGHPYHWSIFAGRLDSDGKGRGVRYQIEGCSRSEATTGGEVVLGPSNRKYRWHHVVIPKMSEVVYGVIKEVIRINRPESAGSSERCHEWVGRVLTELAIDLHIIGKDVVRDVALRSNYRFGNASDRGEVGTRLPLVEHIEQRFAEGPVRVG